jgi:hypothetical protein
MTDREFIEKIITLYRNARQTTFPVDNIKRGKSHSISSQVEDLFAFYISELVDNNIEILIDQPISFNLFGKSKTIYADIAMIKDNVVYQVWDLKTDLGWKRDSFVQFCKDKILLVKGASGQILKLKDGEFKTERILKFSDNLTFNIVVVSGKNISTAKGERNIVETKNLENVGVYFLTNNIHPNSYEFEINELLNRMNFNTNDFEAMKNRIRINNTIKKYSS